LYLLTVYSCRAFNVTSFSKIVYQNKIRWEWCCTEIKEAKTVEKVSSESIIDSPLLLLAVDGGLLFHHHNHPIPPYVLTAYFRATSLAHDIYKLARTFSNLWAGDWYGTWIGWNSDCRNTVLGCRLNDSADHFVVWLTATRIFLFPWCSENRRVLYLLVRQHGRK
jgi:hypothetical protein